MGASLVTFAGCGEDQQVDFVSGLEISLIDDGTGPLSNGFGTPRAIFVPGTMIPPGRPRHYSEPSPNDSTYLDDMYLRNDFTPRKEGYICLVLGECD